MRCTMYCMNGGMDRQDSDPTHKSPEFTADGVPPALSVLLSVLGGQEHNRRFATDKGYFSVSFVGRERISYCGKYNVHACLR